MRVSVRRLEDPLMPRSGRTYFSRGGARFWPTVARCSGWPSRFMELLSRQLRLVRATGFTRRRQVAVLDQAPRSGGVEGGIFGSDGGQPIDVPVKHAEHCGDQN